jgi:hypothetical protein
VSVGEVDSANDATLAALLSGAAAKAESVLARHVLKTTGSVLLAVTIRRKHRHEDQTAMPGVVHRVHKLVSIERLF